MKYRYMKRALKQHLYREPTKFSRQIHRVFMLVMINVSITFINVETLRHMPAPTPMIFINPTHAEVLGDKQPEPVTIHDDEPHELNGNRTVVGDQDENVVEIIKSSFPVEDQATAAAISFAESHHNPRKDSDLDKMRDGRPFSSGLFQINLTWHELDGVKCYEAFSGKNYDAVVVNEQLYDQCIELAKNPIINVATAKAIYHRSGGNFNQWTTYTTRAYVRYLKMF